MDVAGHLRLQVDYDGWATDRLMARTEGLIEEDAGPGASWGSIEGSLRHVLEAHTTWLRRFTGEAQPALRGPGFPALVADSADIRGRLTTFAAGLTDADVYQELHYQDSRGTPHHDYLGVLLSHLVNHGTYHRGEAALLLTRIGRSPGDLDLVVYRRLTEPGR